MVPKFLRPLGALSLTLIALITSLQPVSAQGADRKEAIHKTLLDIYTKQQKSELAAGELKALIALKPNDPVLHGQLGRMFAQKQDFKSAIPQLLICTKNDSGNAEWWGLLGTCYMQTANYSGAVAAYRKAVSTQKPGGNDWRQFFKTAEEYVQHAQQEKLYKEQQKNKDKDSDDDN